MKKSKVLSLALVAAAASIGACALYVFSPADKSWKGDAPLADGTSRFRSSLAAREKSPQGVTEQAQPKAVAQAQAPLFFILGEKLPAPLPDPLPQGVDVKTLPRPSKVLSTTMLNKAKMPNLTSLKKGQIIGLPLPDGRSYDGEVKLVKPQGEGKVRVGGALLLASSGSFTLSQVGQKWQGVVRLPGENLAFVIDTWADGRVLMQEHLLSDLQCLGMAPKDNVAFAPEPEGASPPADAVPLLNSRPGAQGVLYLDFDGETVNDTNWNSGQEIIAAPPLYNGLPLTTTHITAVWQAVAEDFAPFDVTITTDRTLYENAAPGTRMRCIVSPTKSWYSNPNAAGVAYLDSFSEAGTFFDDDVPCWCFGIYDAPSMALVISHELGHTFGLSHDGTASQGYYAGHGSGATSWGPLMGAPYYRTMTQWSMGEYPSANNQEDDVAILANLVNGVGFITDDAGNDVATGTPYNPPNGVVSLSGLLTSNNDLDFYRLLAVSAPLTITCTPSSPFPNLDVTLALYAEDSSLLALGSSDTSLAGTVSVTISVPGNYYVAVSASGNGSGFTGYTDYGSIGAYTLTGSFTTQPSIPVFTLHPLGVSVTEGGIVTLQSNAITTGGIAFQWYKDNAPYTLSPGHQTNTLKITGIKATHHGLYKLLAVNATDANFFAFSNEVMVTVNLKPKITLKPLAASVLAGSSHTFTVTAEGTGPLLYTWERNNVPLGPQSVNPNLELTNIGLAHAGNYRVKVTNATGIVVTSAAVALKVNSPPVIVTHPAPDSAIFPGGSVVLKVTVAGNAPFTYKWFKVGVVDAINKATAASLTVKEAGTYYVEVRNLIGGMVATQSNNAVVVVHAKPIITQQPLAPVVTPTGGVTQVQLAVVANGGGTLLYQWQKDGKNILLTDNPTANSPTLVFDPISWVNRGAYKCIVSNRVGIVTSKIATLKVDSAPIVIKQPTNPTYGPTNGAGSFTVVAGGNAILKYQWYFNDLAHPVSKATAAKLSLSKLTAAAHNGFYFCRITNTLNGGSFVDTIPAELIVQDLPKITSITSDKVAQKHKVEVYGSITLSSTTTGIINTYQWLKAGKVLPGKTQPTLVLSPAQLAETGSYTLLVTNNVGKATSAALAVGVLLPPAINQVPLSVTAIEESTASMSIKASGSPTLKYSWEKQSAGVFQPMVPAKTTSTLTFPKVSVNDAGSYRCVVTNEVGSATSLEALLSVQNIQPATITGFLPPIGKVGQLVRLNGTNLQYLASARFGTTTAAFTIVSDSEILLTVPSSTLDTGVPISLTSKGSGGTVTSAPSVFTRSAYFVNDATTRPVIIVGTASSVEGDTSYLASQEAWHWWIAPRTGQYTFQVHAVFDSTITLYTGTPGALSSYIAFADLPYFNSTGETITFNATANQSFMINIGGYYTSISAGYFSLSIFPNSLSMVANSTFEPSEGFASGQALAGQNGWEEQKDGGTATAAIAPDSEGNHEVHLGGDGVPKAKPVVLLNGDGVSATAGEVVASFKMGLRQPTSRISGDWFSWTLFGADGQSLGALWVSAADGALYSAGSDGTQVPLGRKLSLGVVHRFEMILDQSAGTWDATVDGVTIATRVELPAGKFFQEICPVWLPSEDGSPHATLIFDDVRVYTEKPATSE